MDLEFWVRKLRSNMGYLVAIGLLEIGYFATFSFPNSGEAWKFFFWRELYFFEKPQFLLFFFFVLNLSKKEKPYFLPSSLEVERIEV
jgi:hypothetical protein